MADASRLVTKALEAASFNSKVLARRMKVSDSSLRKYGYGTRTPPPPLLSQLARLLREQAQHLQRVSRALEQLARKQQKAGPRRRKARA